MAVERARKPIEERFWSKVIKVGSDDCWLWSAGKTSHGYGSIGYGARGDGKASAHVFSWKLVNGDVPKGMFVCHKCDIRHCVNPAHLFLGTAADNNTDMRRKGRQLHGEQMPNAKLMLADVAEIIALNSVGESHQRIADSFSVSASLVDHICAGRKWRHITNPSGL